MYAGYPNYLTCNSTHGETPTSRVILNNEDLFADQIDDGIFGEVIQDEDEYAADPELPLPLGERASIESFASQGVTKQNASMNILVIEPVSGIAVYSDSSTGIYVDLSHSQYMFQTLPKTSVKLPYYSTIRRSQLDLEQVDSLRSSISGVVRRQRALAGMLTIISISVGVFN